MPRVVRVLPDVAAIDKTFDYLVPDGAGPATVGAPVRIDLHGRRVGGWIVALDVTPPPGVALRPLAKIAGIGPSADLIDLAQWAAWRWAGRPSTFLKAASPPRRIHGIPELARRDPVPEGPGGRAAALAADALAGGVRVVRMAPAADRYPLVLAACRLGQALVLVPSIERARHLVVRLRRAGVPTAFHPDDWPLAAAGATVIGSRAAAWAPVADLAAVVVLDEHDEAYQDERAPTWHARDVVVERARRAGVPAALVSPHPSLEARAAGPVLHQSRSDERAGWAAVDVVDRRKEDPTRPTLFSERFVVAAGSTDGAVVAVLNRTGRSRLLACRTCGALGRCVACGAAVRQPDPEVLRCRSCDVERPSVCADCGSAALKNLVLGVGRATEEMEALLREDVVEVTGESSALAAARVYVGTEAVLHRVDRAALVAFLDFDQEILAPRQRASEQAMALLSRASRVVRGRAGRVLVQTRLADHPVVQAALRASPEEFAASETSHRRDLGLPPFVAQARVAGPGAGTFVASLPAGRDVEVLGPGADGAYLVIAPAHDALCDLLAAGTRPAARLRVAVDPLRA